MLEPSCLLWHACGQHDLPGSVDLHVACPVLHLRADRQAAACTELQCHSAMSKARVPIKGQRLLPALYSMLKDSSKDAQLMLVRLHRTPCTMGAPERTK